MAAGVVYHWKHGWIPLDHEAALHKAGGDKALADRMLADAPHARGIENRRDIAKATMDLPNLTRPSDRAIARGHIAEATEKHDSRDLALSTWLKTRPHRRGSAA